jgi:cytochrome P450
VSFGSGPHICVGAHLARLEAEVALGTVLGRLQGLQLKGAPPQWVDNFGFRGLRDLTVTFQPAARLGGASSSSVLSYERASAGLLNQ